MKLKCPTCKTELPYKGYPGNPVHSTIMCMTCGYTGPGYAFNRICDICGKDFNEEDVIAEEVNGILEITCKKCATHEKDCGCSQCSGEDRALEAMERGIVAAERSRLGDE